MNPALRVEHLDAGFGATVRDLDLRSLDTHTWAELHEAWLEYALLIFPAQHLTRDEQNEFASRFGDLEFPAAPIANLDRDGVIHSHADDEIVKSLRGNEGWHHDSTYMPVQAKGAVFSAEIVPPSGSSTGFADTRATFEALDPDIRAQLSDLTAQHSLEYSQGRAGLLPTRNDRGGYDPYGYHGGVPPRRPLIKVHPETGRPNLCIGRHAHAVADGDGRPIDPAASAQLLDDLADRTTRAPSVHFHHWTVGDTVVWDNRRLLHCAVAFDMTEPRRMWHTRIAGDPSTERALNYPGADQSTTNAKDMPP